MQPEPARKPTQTHPNRKAPPPALLFLPSRCQRTIHTNPTQTPRSHSGLVAPNDCTEVNKAGRPLGAALNESYIGASKPGSQAGSEKIACPTRNRSLIGLHVIWGLTAERQWANAGRPVQQPGPAARSSHCVTLIWSLTKPKPKSPETVSGSRPSCPTPTGRRERRLESTGLGADWQFSHRELINASSHLVASHGG
jgi:hypothetical protein